MSTRTRFFAWPHIPVERYGKEDKPMHGQAQSLSSRFRTISLVVIATLVMAVAIVPAWAQNSVPPTAVQAAKMPEFASRLAHAAKAHAAPKSSVLARTKGYFHPLQSNDLYDNGPTNGTTDAWTINFGFVVSDSFPIPTGGATVTGMSFAAWLIEGDTLESVQLSITSGENGGTTYFNGVVDFTQSGCSSNQYSYDVCLETSGAFSLPLNNGTYWVNLQNAITAEGEPIYWDENSGPSSASMNEVGTIPSESFTILGSTTTTSTTCATDRPISDGARVEEAKVAIVPPSPTQTSGVIYNFTGGADGANPDTGLTMDAAGNLYGTTPAGGSSGVGTVFKLTPTASGWGFTRLYSFSGTDGNGPDSPLALAPNGSVYGTTGAGGSFGEGVLFGFSPFASVLPNIFNHGMESLRYSFTGGSDGEGPGGSLVLDASGNIYGTARGGANGFGTLYELTNGGIQVLRAFTGPPGDGAVPQGVINGQGGLYGTTKYGGELNSGTVYTTAGGYQILYTFEPGIGSGNPISLTADQAGNLYGTTTWTSSSCSPGGAMVYELSYPDWNLEGIWSWLIYGGTASAWVATDASGNLYGTTNNQGGYGTGNLFKLTCCWTYTDLGDFGGIYGEYPEAAPIVDEQGNIYGTTAYGGAYGYGEVWEISP